MHEIALKTFKNQGGKVATGKNQGREGQKLEINGQFEVSKPGLLNRY